jgi:membrane protein YdbS with pleckstrin-like domain
MTDLVPPTPAVVPPPVVADDGWHALPAAAGRVAMPIGALVGAPIGVGAAVAAGALLKPGILFVLGLGAVLVVAAAVLGALVARAQVRRTRWRLDGAGLCVRRGLFWHQELLVPRSRVQHLDLERGPIERRAGLATLIVHTAGTRLHALRQAGFADADAVALRDALLPERERDEDVL